MLPLVPREKRPLTKNGLLDASTNATTISLWWSEWPNANIGLRTGMSFDVLDVDGEVGLASLFAKTGPWVSHSGPVSRTGRGEHWLFQPNNTANKAGLLEKVDWRGTNGYIVAPPSIHPSGDIYAWDERQGPDTPLPVVPDWLSPLLDTYTPRQPYDRSAIRVIRTQPYQRGIEPHGIVIDQRAYEAQATDIVEMAEHLGYEPVQDGGGRYKIRCPFHEGDNEPSMKLYTHDNSFYCFGCGAWGDALNLRDHRPGGPRA